MSSAHEDLRTRQVAQEDRLREECGVVAIVGHGDAASLAAAGLSTLQHRGQESAGVAVADGHAVRSHKEMGLVNDVFDEEVIASLGGGHLAIGHVRYSTMGSSNVLNAQPIHVDSKRGSLAIAHNGNLTNATQLRERMEEEGSIFNTTSDSEVILHRIARSRAATLEDAVAEALAGVEGAYSLVLMDTERVIAARDPRGFRPLCLGKIPAPSASPQSGSSWVVASETCALDLLGARYERDVQPGEMVILTSDGDLRSQRFAPAAEPALCIFEYVYFSRPDSNIFGRNVNTVRRKQGEILGREAPCDADVVIGVPDSSNTASLGYAHASGIPWELGLIRNHYIGRTFISPNQQARDFSVRRKFNPVVPILKDRRVVVVDDSIVRGTTMRKLVGMIRDAGAREVHLRISSPPITHSCYYGIDTPIRKELIASSHSVEQIAKYLRVDSLRYLSVDGLMEAVKSAKGFCQACFTGEYPVPYEAQVAKDAFEPAKRSAAGASGASPR